MNDYYMFIIIVTITIAIITTIIIIIIQVLATPLRPDLVRYVHTNMSKNKRQAITNGIT